MAASSEIVGQRIAEARGRVGMTQADLARTVALDRSALAKIETGSRRVSALELARLADALDVRIEWFLTDAPPAIVSRRNTQEPGAPSAAIDALIERVARNVEFVIERGSRLATGTVNVEPVPTSGAEAEALATRVRTAMSYDTASPLINLADAVVGIGLLPFSVSLGTESADAATILLRHGGVAVLNGGLHTGRRRLALAHEVGHHVVADEFSVDWRVAEHQGAERRESLLDRFARALLLPAEGVRDVWENPPADDDELRTLAIRFASAYRVDMSTLARRLHELGIVNHAGAGRIRLARTTRADIVELDLVVADELAPPALPRVYEQAVLQLYRSETISAARTLDLLLDTWDEASLPALPKRPAEAIWQYL